MSEIFVLRPNVVVEPLVSGWHAWAQLISPATAALNYSFRLLHQMESFVASPEIHESACKNPNLRGGPFVDLPKSSAPQVQCLIEAIKESCAEKIAFGEALRLGFKQILSHPDKTSLENVYPQLPELIRGYVELLFTLGGHPDLRIIEPLLYKSRFAKNANQSSLMYLQDNDDRPFVFSTPRINVPHSVIINKPFEDEAYDFLGSLREIPRSKEEIYQTLGISEDQKAVFDEFLIKHTAVQTPTADAPVSPHWKYFGHACILVVSAAGKSVLFDPVIPYDIEGGDERFSFKDLPEQIDYVVLTHNHSDHVSIETLLALRWKIKNIIVPEGGGSIADPSLKLMLNSIGFENVIELGPLGSVKNEDIEITAIPFLGEHGDLDIRTKSAWNLRVSEKNLLFAADSNNLEPILYDLIKEIIGVVDILFIGMECLGAPLSWVYGPYLPNNLDRKSDQSRRLNGSDFSKGLKAVESLDCKKVFIYAMGAEPWMQFLTSIDPSDDTPPVVNSNALIKECRSRGILADRLYGKFEETLA